jgi:hypothetical protein
MKLAPINQVIVFKPTRLPAARLVDVQESAKPCPTCEGDKRLTCINPKGEAVREIECPTCGGTGHAL